MIPPYRPGAGLPLGRPSALRFLVVALLVPALLVALAGWLRTEHRHSEQLRRAASEAAGRHVDQLSLLSRLLDAQDAQHDYLLTGAPADLAVYRRVRAPIGRQLISDGAGPRPDFPPAYLAELRRLVLRQLAGTDRVVALRRAGDVAGARRIAASGEARRVTESMRQLIDRRIAVEAAASESREAAFVAYRGWLQRFVYGMVVMTVAILFAVLLILWRSRQDRYDTVVAAFEAAARHATIFDSTVDAILIVDPRGRIETANATACRMLGHPRDDLEGRYIAEVLEPEPGGPGFHERLGLRDGRLRRSTLPDQRARHRDGHAIAVDVAVGVMDAAGARYLVVSLRDIAERKRVERIKDELISTVGHELRTPLTSIVGALGLLQGGVAGTMPAEARRLVEIAESNSRRLIRLINDMLDIDRVQAGKLAIDRARIDMRCVVERACLGAEGLARAQEVRLACSGRPAPVTVTGDAERLIQVVSNLLSNAIRAAPPGSAVDIGLGVEDGRALVSVEDRGAGVPAGLRERIFGRFERGADGEGGGTPGAGLGLAISREIVQRHDGAIWFEDRAGGGTRFAFSLPLSDAARPRDDDGPRVLVCADDEGIARALRALVDAEGCGHDRVRSAAEARAALVQHRYAVLLVSYALPEEGGMALAHSLRDGDPPIDVPVIVVAADAANDGAAPAPLDMVDWIDGPADPRRLARALRDALGRSGSDRPVILHLDDDHDLLDVTAAAIEPDARVLRATDLQSARALLETVSPDVAILDLELADGSGLDLIPFLVDAKGLAIPTILYSARDVPPEQAQRVDAVLVKARGSIPDLRATIHRILRRRAEG